MENTKKSKVIQAAGNGSWNSEKYGTFYKFIIGFENGDEAEYSSKTAEQNKFIVGQEVDYILTSKEVNGKMYYQCKPAPQQAPQGGNNWAPKPKDPETEKRIARMSVLKVAGDLVINDKVKLVDIVQVAQILERYVMTGENSMHQIYHEHHAKKQPTGNIERAFQEEAIKQMAEDDDLPF